MKKNKKKICVVTGTRAEYGLLYRLLKRIQADNGFKLQVIVTGMHLSPEFGLTYKEIETDGFIIDRKVEILLSSDTPSSISKSTGLGLIGFADSYDVLEPDIVILLGDRYEMFSAATAAYLSCIPIAHIHGGETTIGALDEGLRHSISKMATFHFVSAEPYRKRVIQLGEHPDRVFMVGALGIENIENMNLLKKNELETRINFKFRKYNLLVTYHPATLDNSAESQISELLKYLGTLDDTGIIFTRSNSDTGGRIINQLIDGFIKDHRQTSIVLTSMGQLNYLSAMKYVNAVVGNSSSGVIEAPSFRVGTINIGDRQNGRIMAESVINCMPDADSIRGAFEDLFSSDYQKILVKAHNPLAGGAVSNKIIKILKSVDYNGYIKKEFFDL